MTFGNRVLVFYKSLAISNQLPEGVEVLNPYQNKKAFELSVQFYNKYYNDNNVRHLILGINPGRFGAGLTGIPFSDPAKLENSYGIKNDLPKKAELSADFIHAMMKTFGGVEKFYATYFFNSVCPLGFTRDGKNVNYYDTPALLKSLEKFILTTLHDQIDLGINTDVVYCLGEGANYKYLHQVNEREKIFKKIIPLAHPRFIMQYRRMHMQDYIDDYLKKFR